MKAYHIKAYAGGPIDPSLKERLASKLALLQSARPLPPSVVSKLREQFAIEMTYNSNAIEGNTLTLKETFLVIQEGLTVKGKSLKDHLEARDHYDALQHLYQCIENRDTRTLSEVFIRGIHQIIVKNSEPEWAGKYRSGNVLITGSDHKPPVASEVPRQMHELLRWLQKNRRRMHMIQLAAYLHHGIVHIHPFFDGNGRTARIVMNVLLMQAGYPLTVILRNDRKKYYRVLSQADRGNLAPLVGFVARAVERSLNLYLKVLRPATRQQYLSLSEISDRTPYSAKYLNLLARTGKIEAYKERRNWLTTVEAIHKYRAGRLRQR